MRNPNLLQIMTCNLNRLQIIICNPNRLEIEILQSQSIAKRSNPKQSNKNSNRLGLRKISDCISGKNPNRLEIRKILDCNGLQRIAIDCNLFQSRNIVNKLEDKDCIKRNHLDSKNSRLWIADCTSSQF